MNLMEKALGKRWIDQPYWAKPCLCLLFMFLSFVPAFFFAPFILISVVLLFALAYYAGYYFVMAGKQKAEYKLIFYLGAFIGGPIAWFGALTAFGEKATY